MIARLEERQQLTSYYLCTIGKNVYMWNAHDYDWEALALQEDHDYYLVGTPDNLQVYTDDPDGEKRVCVIKGGPADVRFSDESRDKLEEL